MHFAISFPVSDSLAVPLAVPVVSSYQSVLQEPLPGVLFCLVYIYCYDFMQIRATLLELHSSGNSLGCNSCVTFELWAFKWFKFINVSLKSFFTRW